MVQAGGKCIKMSDLVVIIMGTWEISDIISFSALCFSIVAFLISLETNRRFSEKRYIKETTIDDIKNLREDYRVFLNKLMANKCDSRFIISWFKIMNLKMEGLGNFIKSEYKQELFQPCQNKHIELKRYVTGCADMNRDYAQSAITFTDNVKNEIIECYNGLYYSLLVAISKINKK